jgi:hypothetical protein
VSVNVAWALGVLAVFAMGGGLAFLEWDTDRMCRLTIEGALLRYHVTDIKLKRDWMDWDRDNSTYDVEYTDISGKRHYNRCKVATRKFMTQSDDSIVYWESPMIPPSISSAKAPMVKPHS